MKTIALDVHRKKTQLAVTLETGEIVAERIVDSSSEVLCKEIASIPGPKRVVLENSGWAGRIADALRNVADEVIVCDPTRNALIAQADDSDDEQDARRLAELARSGSLHPVYVPPEPFRTLRSMVHYETYMTGALTGMMLRLKAFCRMHGVDYQGKGLYRRKGREAILGCFPLDARFQMTSLYRLLDGMRVERTLLRTELRRYSRQMPVVQRLQTIPGIGPVIARTLVAWIADPTRFKSLSALSAYAGLGLKSDVSNWKPVRRAHASRRGQRALKRVIFLAARAALRSKQNAFAKRYAARRAAGWEDRKAIRDIARKLLFTAYYLWKNRQEYDDGRLTEIAVAAS
jgi:transposase